MSVIYSKRAAYTIAQVAWYVAGKGYPETAEKYQQELYEFGNSLVSYPDKYSICRYKRYNIRKYRCAVFDRTWIFVYKVIKDRIFVIHVVHTSILD